MRIIRSVLFISSVLILCCSCESVTAPQKLNAPCDLTLSWEWDGIYLSWVENNVDEDGYIIFRNDVEIFRTDKNTNSFVDHSFIPLEPIRYYVVTFRDDEISGQSNTDSIAITLEFFDDFEDGYNADWIGYPAQSILKNIDGCLNINGVNDDGKAHVASFYRSLDLPLTFGATMTKIDGDATEPFGLTIFTLNDTTILNFFMSQTGLWNIIEQKEEPRLIASGKSLKISAVSNNVRICICPEKMKVYVNDYELKSLDYQFAEQAHLFSLYTQRNLSINFDNVYLFQNY